MSLIKPAPAPPNIVAPNMELQLFRRSLCKIIGFKKSPCKIGGVPVRNWLRKSPCKLFLGGVAVMLPGVLVRLEGVPLS